MTRLSGQLNARWRRLQESRLQLSAALRDRRPAVHVDLAPWIPCWVARLCAVGLGVAAIVALQPATFPAVVLAAALVLVAVRTSTVTATTFCGLLGVFWLLGAETSWPTDAGLIAIAIAGWMLSGTLSGLGPATRIELGVFQRPFGRYLVIQVVTQPLLAGAVLLRSLEPGGALIAVVTLCCAAAVAAAGWWVLPRLSRE